MFFWNNLHQVRSMAMSKIAVKYVLRRIRKINCFYVFFLSIIIVKNDIYTDKKNKKVVTAKNSCTKIFVF